MKHCKRIWENYYILKMDVRKYSDSIDKNILLNILKRKIKDKNILRLKAYNEIADCCYSKLKNNDLIFIEGKLETDGIISIKFT